MNMQTDIFEAERCKLTSLCYRMLGERSGAEDAVQETWLRWAAADRAQIRNPSAWLRRVATNIAIDTLRAAQNRREIYVGPWLPEPLMQDGPQEIVPHFELAQECELALLWAMERLNERERAAFILREAFDAGYDEIAETLETTPAACRQLVSRSQKKLQETGPRFDASAEEVAALSERFFMAVMAENYEAAFEILTPDTIAISDGGARRRAARRPLVGGAEILQVFQALHEKAKKEQGWSNRVGIVNGKPSLLRYRFEVLDSVTTLAPGEDGRIAWIYIQRNPDKLGLSDQ
ncbi:RNA polymerase sigma-70 factor, ECF family protein [Roseobacter sp. SK209-2-6]|uniref:RNA polymerase sigma factor SigJ n=1 Tax=Roseobacter sp. SK209-2-6 TaxID=388739 RepID=UPI0000F3C534|nr:RNA polymerase sigma factor SigJ [Roseobacter sp. SK209-2-6]EBA18221.1 RNA polymerase sigma-70 factor, ECF family protein [Roseobacter sp. SK209-2-6]